MDNVTVPMELKVECEGWFRLEKAKVDSDGNEIPGTREVVADWFRNLITNAGLDMMPVTGNWLGACHVGSGSVTPAVTDTTLQSRIGASSTVQAEVNETNVTDFYGFRRKTFRFAAGTATGNISELGIADVTASPGYKLFSRALVLDGLGNPTTITILSDEVLDVIYEFRLYAPLTDNTGSVTLASEGSTHDWVSRALDFDGASTAWNYELGQAFNCNNFGANWYANAEATQTLRAITADGYSGTYQPSSVTRQAYTNGNYYVDFAFFCDLNNCNISGGIGKVAMSGSFGAYQWSFNPKIPKVNTKKLTLNLRLSWARKAL